MARFAVVCIIVLIIGSMNYFKKREDRKVDKPKGPIKTFKLGGEEKSSGESSYSKSDNKLEEVTFPIEESNSSSDFSSSKTVKSASTVEYLAKAIEIHRVYNRKLSATTDELELTNVVKQFLKQYIATLGKAYNESKGHNKTALKAIKIFIEDWYKNLVRNAIKVEKNLDIIEWNANKNLIEAQAGNRYALIELAKVVKEETSYITRFKANFRKSRAIRK